MPVINFPKNKELSRFEAERIVLKVEYELAETEPERLAVVKKFNTLRIKQAIFERLNHEPR